MSVDTTLRLKGHITDDQLTEFIRIAFDPQATNSVEERIIEGIPDYAKVNYGSPDHYTSRYGRIDFKYPLTNGGSETRSMFYSYSTINTYENLEYYTRIGTREMVLAETTYCSVGMWGHSVEIMEKIARAFDGGWIEDNDCADAPPRWVAPDDAPSFFSRNVNWLEGGYCVLVAHTEQLKPKFQSLAGVKDKFVLAAPKYREIERIITEMGKSTQTFFGKDYSYMDAAKACESASDYAFVYIPEMDVFLFPSAVSAEGVRAYTDFLGQKLLNKGFQKPANVLRQYAGKHKR